MLCTSKWSLTVALDGTLDKMCVAINLGPLHTRDHFTSTIVIGGKGKVGPSLLHTILEGPMEYMTARWMSSLHGFLHNIEWIMFHGHLDYFQKPSLGGRPNTKLGDHDTPNAHKH